MVVEEERSDGTESESCDGNVPGSSANKGYKHCMVRSSSWCASRLCA